MTTQRLQSAAARTARETGSEAIAQGHASQQETLTDNPRSHLRNALAVTELIREAIPPHYLERDGDEYRIVPVSHIRGLAETIGAALEQLEARHAIPADADALAANLSPTRLIGYAQTALFDLVDQVPANARGLVVTKAAAINRFLVAAATELDVARDRARHAPELERSQDAASQMLAAIGPSAAAAFVADLLVALTAGGYLLSWGVTETSKAAADGVHVAAKYERDELARRRRGHASDLAEMERTNAELERIRREQEG